MNSKHCVMCLKLCADVIDIFGENGKTQHIAEIISKHFSFKTIQPDDTILQMVCVKCWTKTHTFHEFYNTVEIANREYFLRNRNENFVENNEVSDTQSLLTMYGNFELTMETDGERLDWNRLVKDENAETFYEDATAPIAEPINVTNANEDKSNFNDFNNVNNDETDEGDNGYENDCDTVFDTPLESVAITAKDNLMIPSYFDMTCDRCNATFKTLLEARRHYIYRHNRRDGYIKCCKNRYNRAHRVRDHILWHQNPNYFMCHQCKKSYSTRQILRSHMANKHSPEDKKKFVCDKCGKRFSKKSLMSAHILFLNCSGSEEFSCHICQKKLKSKPSLKSHITLVHDDAFNHKSICEFCAKVFKTKSALKAHLSTHTKNVEARVQCDLCGSSLQDQYSLKLHIQRTHDSKPRNCPHCDKILQNRHSLINHISRVHTKPTHHCTLCDKSFTRILALKEHIASHTGEDLYTCSYCPRSFKSNSNMYKHQKRIHLEQWNADRKQKTIFNVK